MSKITYPNLGGFNQSTTNQLGSVGGQKQATTKYSLAEVQLTNGEMVGMMITGGPSLGQHLTKAMASDGYLNLFNDSETLIIKADRVVAVKLTLMTTE